MTLHLCVLRYGKLQAWELESGLPLGNWIWLGREPSALILNRIAGTKTKDPTLEREQEAADIAC